MNARDLGVFGVLAALFVGLSIYSGPFRSTENLKNIVDQLSINGIAACGATLAIVSGVFDLSMGSIYAVSAITSVVVANSAGTATGFVAGVAVGAALGLVNGLIVAIGRINSFIATLATSFGFAGVATVFTGGTVVATSAAGFRVFGDSWIVTIAGWGFVLVAIVSGVTLSATSFGRGLYAVGGNQEAARLAGLRVEWYRISVFVISGICAGLGGVIDASRIASAQATVGSDLSLTAIAATVVGGTSILGGHGTIGRAMIGVLILEIISNGFGIVGVNPIYQNIVYGGLILVSVGIDQVFSRRTS